MKPTRIRMCHSLVMNYGLYKKMEIFVSILLDQPERKTNGSTYQRAKPATKREMTQFHSDQYIDFLSKVTPANAHAFHKESYQCARTSASLAYLHGSLHVSGR